MKFRALDLLLILALAGCAGAPSRVFIKDDVTWTNYRGDLENCHDQARGEVPVQSVNMRPPSGLTLTQNFAVGAVGGFFQGLARAQAEYNWATQCMEDKGYTKVDLEQSERSKLAALKTDEQRTQFLRGEPIGELSVKDAPHAAAPHTVAPHTSASLNEPQPISSGSSTTPPELANINPPTTTTNSVGADSHGESSSLPGPVANLPAPDPSQQLLYWRLRSDPIRKAIANDHTEIRNGFGFAYYRIDELKILDADSRVGDGNLVALTVRYNIVLRPSSIGGDPALEPVKWFQRTIIVDNGTESVHSIGDANRID